jgi:hypothetical protein
MAVVAIVTAVVLVWQLVALGRPRAGGRSPGLRDAVPLLATALAGAVTLVLAGLLPNTDPLLSFNGIVPELLALVAAVPLGLIAVQVVTARDGRRFVLGLVAAAGVWFVILYPNISALPLPANLVNAYQGLLPTYLYPFQFGVNTVDRSGAISFADPKFAILMVAIVIASGVVAYGAWAWRQSLAEEGAEGTDTGDAAGEAGRA